MEPALAAKFLHILAAMAWVVGLVGRSILIGAAARSTSMVVTDVLLDTVAPFERLVIWSSVGVIAFGLATAWLQSLPILGALQSGAVNWVLISLVLFIGMQLTLVPTILIPGGRVFEIARQGARRIGKRTPELQAAFNDSRVRVAHGVEFAVTLFLIAVMVLKPF